MKKSLSRAIAVTAVCAAGVSGALVTNPAADAARGHSATHAKPVPTNFGYKGDVYGAKVLVDGVELRTLKDAYAQQRCTSYAGREVVKNSTVSVPGNDYVHVSALSSSTETYRDAAAGLNGVKGISTVGDVVLGATDGSTPKLSLQGLRSISNAFYDAKTGTFGHQETFTAPELTITNLPDGIPPELQDLLDTLTQTGGQVTGAVIDVLQQATGGVIEIPGLGSIGLAGVKSGSATSDHAISETYALRLMTDLTGHPTVLELGRARTRIARPVPGGVFRSTAMGLDMFSGNALHMGNLGQRSIPCEGTGGKVKKQHLADASVLGGLATLTGIDYAFMGKQLSDGSARGMVSSKLGKITLDSIGLEIDGIASTVHMYKPAGTNRVRKSIDTSIAKILVNGEEVAVPKPGETIELGDGTGNFLQYRVVKNNFYGSEVHAVVLTLSDSFTPGGSIMDLGWAAGKIFPR
ncbi:hypothetical protein [Nocardioides sp. LS1]|uniref:hypothetical protein n=1 Tax=Nocardioides sp. LS1 TaxID=1027620 RepID=UPI000F6193C3|nr:hypothetical protein [Nocardioides sp. LS1]GCD88311.1 hypothetical protein NLS1_03170 [Nocardioides sp. LS1]